MEFLSDLPRLKAVLEVFFRESFLKDFFILHSHFKTPSYKPFFVDVGLDQEKSKTKTDGTPSGLMFMKGKNSTNYFLEINNFWRFFGKSISRNLKKNVFGVL